jgi:methylenetetrahydrofolate reductase (NADPH)
MITPDPRAKPAMDTLREKMEESSRFLVGTELVSTRGGMAERSAIKAREFADQLVGSPDIDWISITDNAGGNPQLSPTALGTTILYAGKEVVIHVTCKDLNRNALESEAWLLSSFGFNNILAMTGDYPGAGNAGNAKPVFDIDSVGLISMLAHMNEGLNPADGRGRVGKEHLGKTKFFIGAVTTNFKLREGEVMPQYFKLAAKVAGGARFIINQIGFDARKMHELLAYMRAHEMGRVPLIGNVYLLSAGVAAVFNKGRIPGVVVSNELNDLCARQAGSPDGGKAFFLEFAAKQVAIYRGLGFRGVYLGGAHNFAPVAKILEIERTFAPDDWKQFAREIAFSRPGEYYHYARDPATGLADPSARAPSAGEKRSMGERISYRVSKWFHGSMFTRGRVLNDLGAKLCARAKDPAQGPKPLREIERLGKTVLFRCKDCGDCSLPEIAYLCPESQCAKNQRNGPCGGTRAGRCEVDGFGECIWLRAYERLKRDGRETGLLAHAPVVQNQALRGTSSWANNWLGRDHYAKKITPVSS